MRILALYTDAFGGYGGIATANRHFLRALCAVDGVDEVVALPRLVPNAPEGIPEKLTHRDDGLGGKAAYLQALLRLLATDRAFDLVWCGHVHLVPLALLAKRLTGAPVTLHVHGIEVWEPTQHWLVNRLVSRIDQFLSVSDVTRQRFSNWTGVLPERGRVLPNTIDFDRFGPGEKDPDLLDRYGLTSEHYILMTLGRLAGPERAKGFDKILEVLPDVAAERPSVRYLIVGKGPDRERLEAKAERLEVRDRVVFAGYVEEAEKAAHYRLADRYVMPSRGEGFGIAILEALACGVPVVASAVDGGREAVAEGRFGRLVDPSKPDDLKNAILTEQTPAPPAAVRAEFGKDAYEKRVAEWIYSLAALEKSTSVSGGA